MQSCSLFFCPDFDLSECKHLLDASKLTYRPYAIDGKNFALNWGPSPFFDTWIQAHQIHWYFDQSSGQSRYYVEQKTQRLWFDSFGAFYRFPLDLKSRILLHFPYKVFFDNNPQEGSISVDSE